MNVTKANKDEMEGIKAESRAAKTALEIAIREHNKIEKELEIRVYKWWSNFIEANSLDTTREYNYNSGLGTVEINDI